MQYEYQSERCHRIRFVDPQLLVRSLVPNQMPIEGNGTYPTYSYKVDCAPKHFVQGKTPKVKLLPVSYYLEMHDLLYLSALVNNCYDSDTSYLELVKSRTTQGTRDQNSLEKFRFQKTEENFIQRSKLLVNLINKNPNFHGQKIADTALLEPL